jgi:hypothetical protein
MALRDSLPPAWLLAVTVLAGLAAGVLYGKSGPAVTPTPAPVPAPVPVPVPVAVTAPAPGRSDFPPTDIAKALGESIPAAFGEDPRDPALRAAREEAWTKVKDLVARWGAASPRSPLANATWWRAALRSALPSGAGQPRGLFDTTVRWLGRESPVTLSVPAGSGPFPAVVALLDGGNPREEIPALYGPRLRSHLVVGVPWDAVLAEDPRAALLALDEVARRYPVDPDLLVLDGTGRGAAAAAALAADAARQFAGVVLRGPPEPGDPAENLGLLSVLAALPEGATGDQNAAASAVRAACPGAKVVVGDPAEPLADWLAALPRRASADPARAAAWASITGDRFRSWGPGFVVKRCLDPAAGKTVRVKASRDPARNAVVLETENVAEVLLLLSDEGLDLDRPVKVVVGGMVVEERKVERSLDAVRAWATRGDAGQFTAAELLVRIPE